MGMRYRLLTGGALGDSLSVIVECSHIWVGKAKGQMETPKVWKWKYENQSEKEEKPPVSV